MDGDGNTDTGATLPGAGGQPGGGGPGDGGQPGGGGGDGGATAFLDGFTGDNRAFVETKGWKGGDDLVTSYRALEARTGARVVAPDAGAPDDIKARFRDDAFKALGRPDSPDGYEFTPAEGKEFTDADKAFHAAMRPALWDAGVSAEGMAKLNGVWNEHVAAVEAQTAKAFEEFAAAGEKSLRDADGARYDERQALAEAALGRYEGLAGELGGQPLTAFPALRQALADLGQAQHGDGAPPTGGGGGGDVPGDPKAAEARLSQLQADPEFQKKIADKRHPEHRASHDLMLRLQRVVSAAAEAKT